MEARPSPVTDLGGPGQDGADRISRRRQRRRPSGEPPPLPRSLNTSARYWLAAWLLVMLVGAVVFLTPRAGLWMTYYDQKVVEAFARLRVGVLTDLMLAVNTLGVRWTIRILGWTTLLALLVFRRFRHLLVFFGSRLVVNAFAGIGGTMFQRPRPFGIEILGGWDGYAMPSRPVATLAGTLVGMLYSLVPEGRYRQVGKVVAGVAIGALALARVYLGTESPTDVLFGAIIGVAVPLLAFRLLVPNEIWPVAYRRGRSAHLDVGGARGEAIRRALEDQLGLIVVEVKPFGLEGSAGSTPLRVTVKGDPDTRLFAKLYAQSHLRSDRWYKLGRTLLYGRLEDEAPFQSVRRLVQYEDYALRLLRDAGLPSPEPYGIVEITPELEYLILTEFFGGAVEIGEAEIDDDIIDDGLLLIRRLWDAGLAHRDIKPANLLVRDRRIKLIDVAFAEVRPTPWRQAVDLANMMLVLALRTDPERVYRRALRFFNDEEIGEAFAATRGLTMPSQLRRMIRTQGRDLHAEFLALLPRRPQPISIQRWSGRRVLLTAAVVVGALLAFLLAVANLQATGLI
jgi:membrane-associated phospholipid phosphatase/tRNA A-37 threonylcarbamoyl transferase component Bud32